MTLALRVLCSLAILFTWPALVPNTAIRLSTVTTAVAQESVKVWVNTRSGVYHCPGGRYYGNTKAGEFMFEAEARAAGNRPAYGQSCGPSAAASPAIAPQPLSSAAPAVEPTGGIKVWVNTSSWVYHCPGSRHYGNTKSGRFMSESEARAAGHRPAYGRACG
jgi:hypothetical protein